MNKANIIANLGNILTKLSTEEKVEETKEVKLATMMLADGETIIEADEFVEGQSVFVVTEDARVPLPIGEYALEDGQVLMVEEEGVIASVSAPQEEEEAPAEAPAEEVEQSAEEVKPQAKKVVESNTKETHFSKEEFDSLKSEVESLKTQLSEMVKENEVKEVKEVEMNEDKRLNSAPSTTEKKSNPYNLTTESKTTRGRIGERLEQLNLKNRK